MAIYVGSDTIISCCASRTASQPVTLFFNRRLDPICVRCSIPRLQNPNLSLSCSRKLEDEDDDEHNTNAIAWHSSLIHSKSSASNQHASNSSGVKSLTCK